MATARVALAWSFGERYISLAMNVASTVILARLLTPSQVGLFSLCSSVIAIAGMLRDFGVSEYVIQERDLTKDKMRAAFGVAVLAAWSMGGLLFLSRGVVAAYYKEPLLEDVVAVLSLNFFILPLASPAFALFNRELEFRKVFIVQTCGTAVQCTTSVVMAYLGHGTMSLAWASVAGILTQALMVTFLRPHDSLIAPKLRGADAVVRFGSLLVVTRVVESITRSFHEFTIAKQFGFAQVGFYSRAAGLVDLFNQNVTMAILRVATPSLAADHRAGVSLTGAYARGTAIFTCVAWTVLGFIALTSREIIQVLFGVQWLAAAPLATIVALGASPTYLIALANNVLVATGNVRRRARIMFTYMPIHLAGVLVASYFSLYAVAGVMAFNNVILALMYMRSIKQVIGSSWKSLYGDCLDSALVAGVSVLAQAAVLTAAREAGLPPLVNLALVIPTGAAAWWVMAQMRRHAAAQEAMRFWRQLRPARA